MDCMLLQQLLVSLYIYWLHFLTGKAAIPILWRFFDRYSTPEEARVAKWKDIANMIEPLGLYAKRAKMIIRFSGKVTQPLIHCGYCTT